jgi:hypothetical protein
VLREMFVLIWQQHDWPRQAMGFDHWNRLTEVVHRGGRLDLPGGVVARRVGRTLVVERPASASLSGAPPHPGPEGSGYLPAGGGNR